MGFIFRSYSDETTRSFAVAEMANIIGSDCHPERSAGFNVKGVLNELNVSGIKAIDFEHLSASRGDVILNNKNELIHHLNTPDQTSTTILANIFFKEGLTDSNGNPTLIPVSAGGGHRIWIRGTHEYKINTIIAVDPRQAPRDKEYILNELNEIKGFKVNKHFYSTLIF